MAAEADPGRARRGLRRLLLVPHFARAAYRLVYETNRVLATALLLLALLSGVLPAAMTYLGKRVIDVLVRSGAQGEHALRPALLLVLALFALGAAAIAVQRGLALADALLRVQLAQRVTELILNKALSLSVEDFDDPELNDRLVRIQQHAAERPLSLVRRSLATLERSVATVGFSVLLASFSLWLPLLLLLAAAPAVLVELRYNTDAFRLFRFRSPESRRQAYIETVLTRNDHAKESHLFGLGPLLVARHRAIFDRVYAKERALTLRRAWLGLGAGLFGAAALAFGYVAVIWAGVGGAISIGSVAMLFIALRQVQVAATESALLLSGLHEDHLYLADLEDFLRREPRTPDGSATIGTRPGDGLRFEDVWFTYPDAEAPAICGVSFHLPRGASLGLVGQNGAGKTTLLKLALGLLTPMRGRVTFDGVELRDWQRAAFYRRVGVIFQDFVRYQLLAGENIGVGDVSAFDDEARWAAAARQASASEILERLPAGYRTQLGRWFEAGQDLSLGEWQRVALARLFMRRDADFIVLDEPTSSLDAQSEALIGERLSALLSGRLALVVSHRPELTALVDRVLVLEHGRIAELRAGARHVREPGGALRSP